MPEKEKVLREIAEEELIPIVPESQQETGTEPKDSTTNFELAVKEDKCEVVEDIPEIPRPLSQEAEKGDFEEVVSVIPTLKASVHIERVPTKVIID